jgi:hypothetical protein
VQLEVVVLVFAVLVLPLVLVLWVVVLQLVGVLGYLICRLLLVELVKDKQGILVSLGLPVLFLQCQELVGRQWLIHVALVGLVVLGMVLHPLSYLGAYAHLYLQYILIQFVALDHLFPFTRLILDYPEISILSSYVPYLHYLCLPSSLVYVSHTHTASHL